MQLSKILGAQSYLDLFQIDKNPVEESDIKERYRALVKVAHPDTGGNATAFQIVRAYYNESLRLVRNGEFGTKTKTKYAETKSETKYPTITSKNATYQLIDVYQQTDISIIYNATDGKNKVFVKVVKSPSDNDLMMSEQTALEKLHSYDSKRNNNEHWEDYTPSLIESFNIKNKNGIKQSVHVFKNDGEWYTLKAIMNTYAYGLNPRDAIWMLRRILMVVGFAADNNIVHGAITPQNIIIYPEQHGLRLINWENSVQYSKITGYTKTPTADMTYREYYPASVLAGQPTDTYNDLYMVIQLAKQLFKSKDTPHTIQTYLRRYDNIETLKTTNAWRILSEFDDVIRQTGEPYYPKRWHNFIYPK